MRKHLFFLAAFISVLVSCKKGSDDAQPPISPSEKSITEVTFKVADNPGLPRDFTTTFSNDTFTVTLPRGISRAGLIPHIKYNGASLFPVMNTRRDFGTVLTYTVRAQDGSLKDYFVNARTETFDLIVGYWNIFRDSAVANGSFFIADPGGGMYYFPSLNYHNIPGDYYDFRANSTFTFHGDNRTNIGIFSINGNGKFLLSPLLGPANITTLTATDFKFTWSLTSSNGGTYEREIWLKR